MFETTAFEICAESIRKEKNLVSRERIEINQANNEIIMKGSHFARLQIAIHNVTSVWSDPNAAAKKLMETVL